MHTFLLVLLLASSCYMVPVKNKQTQPISTVVPQVAREEDVNILAFGILQFRQGLQEMYQSTTKKLASIRTFISLFDKKLQNLKTQALVIKQKTRERRSTVQTLKMEEKDMQNRGKDISNLMNGVLMAHSTLRDHMRSLEEVLRQSAWRDMTEERQYLDNLKIHIEKQKKTLEGLRNLIQYQQQLLAGQTMQLSQLQDLFTAYKP